MDEREALARLKRGDINGLETLVKAYQVQAVRAAYLVTRDRAQAEDIVQAAFLRIYQRFDQFDMRRPFAPWFMRVVVNDALKVVTRHRQLSLESNSTENQLSLEDLLPDSSPSPADLVEDAEMRQAVWDALGNLSPEQRAAIVLRYYLDLSEREMAEALTLPRGTIKWRLHAAREHLRTLLRPLHNADVEAYDEARP
jgi:RNA polymerase sigma-70 factor, ECF subfamily